MAEGENISALRKTWQHLPAEFQQMLEKDMTLRDASGYHRREWRMPQGPGRLHEASHVILGLLGQNPYQASYNAEVLVFMIENVLNASVADKYTKFDSDYFHHLKETALHSYKRLLSKSCFDRTLYWLIGKETGESALEIKKRHDYEATKIAQDAASYGVTITDDSNAFIKWKIIDNKGEEYYYDVTKLHKVKLPLGSNGVENFEKWAAPSENELNALIRSCSKLQVYLSGILTNSRSPDLKEYALLQIPVRDLFRMLPPMVTAERAMRLDGFDKGKNHGIE